MKKLLLVGVALGLFCAGFSLPLNAEKADDLDFLLDEEPAPKPKPPVQPEPTTPGKDQAKPVTPTKPAPVEEELDFGDLEATVQADKAAVKPEPIVYPPAPENKEPEKKEDPAITFYKNLAKLAKGFTYDQLPEPIKTAIEEHVIDPVKNHLKAHIKLTDLTFERPEPGVFKIIGNTVLYGQKAKVIIREATPEKGKPHYSLIIELPGEIRLSNITKELSIIDLRIEKPKFIFSGWKYEDKELGITVEQGYNLAGDVMMEGALKPIQFLTKIKMLRMYGTIKKGLIGTTINGLIPGELSLGSGTKLTKMIMGVTIVGKLPLNTPAPQFVLKGDLAVKIAGQSNPVLFTSLLELGVEKATLNGLMQGMWDNPFGINGLSIGDVGVSASVLYAGTLDGLGIKGTVELGDKVFKLATKGSVTDGAAFIGEMQGELSYKDIVVFANRVTKAGLPVDTIFKVIPNVSLKNPLLQIVPVTTVIMGENYSRGTSFRGGVTIFGKTTTMNITVLKDGLKGSAVLPELEVKGLFSLKGMKDSAGTVLPPEVTLNIVKSSSKIAELYARGIISLAPAILGGATADGFVDFSAAGTNITMKARLFNQFMFDIDLKSKMSLTEPPTNMVIKASMSADGGMNDLVNRLRNLTKSVLGDPAKLEGEAKAQANRCAADKIFSR